MQLNLPFPEQPEPPVSEVSNGSGTPTPPPVEGVGADNIRYVNISQETRSRYLNYAMSVISSRALPDVRDGLKPVQRRLLFTMYDSLSLRADSKYIKCQRICGETIGKFHPHSPEAAYEALARLAQDFSVRYPLVAGWGNFGSLMGLPPASPRYTEARPQKIAEQLMNELRFETVELRPNYDAQFQEPVVLPARFPQLLVNGCEGIAVGMATSIPPHNLGEVIKAAIQLIHEPDATVKNLMKSIKGPDFPLGGRIVTDRASLLTTYEEGRGTIKVRAEWKLDVEKRKELPDQIVIYSLPYGVRTSPLMEEFGQIIAQRKLPQLVDASDQTDSKFGLRIVLQLKSGSDTATVMSYLYKHTQLEQNFGYNATALTPDTTGALVPKRMSLVELLKEFLTFRLITVRKRFEYLLRQIQKRIHILEGFEIIFGGLDKAIRIIRASNGKADAAKKLMAVFPLDQEQVDAVLDMALYRISQFDIDQIIDELEKKRAEEKRLLKILGSEKLLWGVVETELNEVSEQYADKRRTTIGSSDEISEFDPQAYIVKENTNVVVTRDAWIKRVGRLAKIEGTRVREGDEVLTVVPGSTLEQVVFFSSEGIAYTLSIDQIPVSSGYGDPLSKYCKMGDGARIITALSTDPRFTAEDAAVEGEEQEGPFLIVATQKGNVLRVPLKPFRPASTKSGRKFCRLAEGDRVVHVELQKEATTMFLATTEARILHFAISEVPVLSGAGKGVRGIKLATTDNVLGAALMTHARDCLHVMTTADKEMTFGQTKYEVASRGGKGIKTVQRSGFESLIRQPIELVDWAALEGEGTKGGSSGG